MNDDPTLPRRRKSRRKMRRITVPGDDVPRAMESGEEEIDLAEGDEPEGEDVDIDHDQSADLDDDGGFEDEPTDPSVFSDEVTGPRASVSQRQSVVPPAGGSIVEGSVVVSRSHIISDHPTAVSALPSPPPAALPLPPSNPTEFAFDNSQADVADEPVIEASEATDTDDEDDEEDSRPTIHPEAPSAPVRTRTPPPPPAASIMIAADYVSEMDQALSQRSVAPEPTERKVSAPPPPVSARPVAAPARVSNAPANPAPPHAAAATTPSKPEALRPPPNPFPEHATGPRVSVSAPPSVPSVPNEMRAVAKRPEASVKPNPPAPPRKILTPVPPAQKPPPPPPKENAAKRPPPWWKTFFSDDYLRSVHPLTPQQVKRQCDFVEAVLNMPRGATVLEVGCGTGLQAIELTERGYLVVGLDLSLPMITRAAEEAQYRNLRINFLHTDIREIQFEGAFDAVTCLGTTFGFFDDEANRNVLVRLRDALKPGGRLLLDIVNRDHVIATQPNLVWFQGDGCVCMEESEFNYFTSRLHVKRTMMHEDGRQSDTEYSIRLYALHEIGQMLHAAGFRVIEVSGHPATRGVYFGATSTQIIVLAERRAARPEGDAAKPEPVGRATKKVSLRPAQDRKPAGQSKPTSRESSDDLTELVEEVSQPSVAPSGFDDEEATDPNVAVSPKSDE